MQNEMEFDLAVIGSGPAGQKAAVQGAKAGKRVAVIEQNRAVGGACVHHGTIPSKTLREAALQMVHANGGSRAVTVSIPEHVKIESLLDRLDEVVNAHDQFIDSHLARNNITRIHGRARFRDANTLEIERVDGSRSDLLAPHVVIACGSRPRRPDNVPVDHEHILDSDSILSMTYLPRSLIILGGGVIASEYASIFAVLGVSVTMIDKYARPLGFLDAELCDRFVKSLESYGGRYLAGREVAGAAFDGVSDVVVSLADGSEVRAEKLLSAQGRVANIEGLSLENAGVEVSDAGLIVADENLRTTVPHIYAAGDVIGPPALASSAMEQGRRAACHALEIDSSVLVDIPPTGIYTVPELSCIGLSEKAAEDEYGSVVVGRADFREVARSQISGARDGLLKMVCEADTGRVLGVHVFGDGATELVHLGQMGIANGYTAEHFVETVFNFPTLAEGYRIAALDCIGRMKQIAETAGAQKTG